MHDADRWFEDRLRIALREEAAAMSFTLTVADLERRLAERRRRRVLPLPWAAALALLLIGAAAVGLAGTVLLRPDPTPVPSPAPSAAALFPAPEAMLADAPTTSLRLEARRTAPDTVAPSPAPGDRHPVGTFSPVAPFVIATTCAGPERIVVEAKSAGNLITAPVPCDGAVHVDPSTAWGDGDTEVTVIAPPEATWAVAVGEYPASWAEPPVLPPVDITPGWTHLLGDVDEAMMASSAQGTGLGVAVPPAATRVAAIVTCVGDSPAIATLGGERVEIDCASQATGRVEAPVDPTGQMMAEVTTDGIVWARILIEIDAPIEITYPSAPPLPEDVAATGWAAPGVHHLTVGTIGGNRPRLLDLGQNQPSVARGDLVAVPVATGEGGGRLELVSIADGTSRTLTESAAFIQKAWLDATHEQVVYVTWTPAGLDIRVIGTDGSRDRSVARIPIATGEDVRSVSAELAWDDASFVLDRCFSIAGCDRTIVDLATERATEIPTDDAAMCSIFGVIDGLVVGTHADGCAGEAPRSVAIDRIEGGDLRLVDGVGEAYGVVIDTPDGPRAVVATAPGEDAPQSIVAIDLTTGEAATVLEVPGAELSSVSVMPVRLPPGYVLLATSLSDEPSQRGFIIRAVPTLLDVTTGETTPLPNLPHTLEAAP